MKILFKFLTYFSVFASGASILIIEILGTRLLAPLYGTTIYVWSGLITVTLFALALGYIFGGKFADKTKSYNWFFSLFILSGISVLVMFKYKAAILLFSESFGYDYGPLAATTLLFTLPLFFLGMVDPFAIKLKTEELSTVGSRSGFIFALSTVGGLTGALSSAYFLLPLFSLTNIFVNLSIFLIILGLIGIAICKLYIPSKTKALKHHILFFLGIIILSLLASSYGTSLSKNAIASSDRFGQAEILYEKQNLYSLNRVLAVPNKGGVLCFSADGGLQTCIDPNNKDHIGYTGKMGLFIESLPKDSSMLLLGLGGGKIIKEWGRDDIDTDIVDINPATFYAAENYMGIKFSQRQKTHLMDARRFLRTNEKKYDLVLIDVSTTFTPPTHLYTQEFFQLVASRLQSEGVAIFQFTEEDITNDGFQMVLSTIQSVLPYTYKAHDGVVLLLVMGKEENKEKIDFINSKVRDIQEEFNAQMAFHEFLPINTELKDNLKFATDDYNLAEISWRKKIPLFKRFNILLKEDLI